jgi:glycosyltransferase involved in cell wall biosynthesis
MHRRPASAEASPRTAGFATIGLPSVPRPARTLILAPKECWPPDTGAKIRSYHLAREVAGCAQVTYLGFRDAATPDVSKSNPSNAPAAKRERPAGKRETVEFCETVVTVDRDQGYGLSNLIRGAVTRTPISVLNYTTAAMRQKLAALLETSDFQIVQMESVHLVSYLPALRAARTKPVVILDWHNIESELMERYSEHAPDVARRYYARATARKLRDLERRALVEFDAHLVVSERDRARLLDLMPAAKVFVIENGVDIDYYCPAAVERAHSDWIGGPVLGGFAGETSSNSGPRPVRRRVLLVGSMDYHANADAAAYFSREIWPALRKHRPDLTFTIVGRSPGPQVRALGTLPGVEVTGTVDDVRPYYREALASVVPLRVGGGSRLKILEAMAAGVPVVSTTLGAEGLDVSPGKDVIIADTPIQLEDSLASINAGDEQWDRLVDAGRSLVVAKYGWGSVGAQLNAIHRSLIRAGSGADTSPVDLLAH